jgi:hypothetical protein
VRIGFARFEGSLPYASKLYGVYQPLLGWKARRMKRRFLRGVRSFRREAVSYVASKI